MAIDRRDFLKLLGVSAAAPMVGCASQPVEKIIPYVVQPEDVIPGVATYYATVCRECPAGCGLLVRTREGRAVKVEGNSAHPVNRGALCARGQAALQGLYNPDRIRQPLHRNASGVLTPLPWEDAENMLAAQLRLVREEGRAEQIAFLTSHLTGSLHQLMKQWLDVLGSQNVVVYEPFGYEALRRASQICFDHAVIPTYAIDKARFLVSFGADFLETWLSPVSYAKAFGHMHSAQTQQPGTFVQVEPRLSLTGANADEWVPIKPGTESFLALGMTRVIVEERQTVSLPSEEEQKLAELLEPYPLDRVAALTEVSAETIRRLARSFARQRPSLAIGGGVATHSRESTASLIAIHLLNYVVGNIGETVLFGPTENLNQLSPYETLRSLAAAMARREVSLLLIYNTNPAFTLPGGAGFADALATVPLIVSFSSFLDETTEHAHLILPDHTPLESWGDYSPRTGVHGLMQPVMLPVFDTKAVGDVLLSVATRIDEETKQHLPWKNFFDYLRDVWKELHRERADETEFDTFWRQALQQGGIWENVEPAPVQLSPTLFQATFSAPQFDGGETGGLTLIPYPSSRYFDGRGANKPWLQELPDPITNVVWDTWIEIHPQMAAQLGITEGDLVTVTSPHGTLEVPAYLYAGMRPDVVAMPLGQGHTGYGRYATGYGVNPARLLSAEPEKSSGGFPWLSTKVQLARIGRRARLVTTDGSRRQLGRDIAQVGTPGELTDRSGASPPSHDMYRQMEYGEYRWGMAIDLSACIGCGACVTACYAENNIPVVGKERVAQGREMAWLRIERYFEEQPASPKGESFSLNTRFIPMLCQHCGNAPCEPVCPVYATYHNPEGLNAQIYNRCVGTRYCSNNCPYKVRRFNWFSAKWPEPLHLQLNPDVTVREKGVMEKCTFCVQRIQAGKDRAKDENRLVRDGEITPACAQTCPTQAILFGNLEDPDSRVSRLARDPRAYQVFEALNTKPAITYLKKMVRPLS